MKNDGLQGWQEKLNEILAGKGLKNLRGQTE